MLWSLKKVKNSFAKKAKIQNNRSKKAKIKITLKFVQQKKKKEKIDFCDLYTHLDDVYYFVVLLFLLRSVYIGEQRILSSKHYRRWPGAGI